MKQMSIKKQIRIQKLQNKNRMVGKTFNPSGITSEDLKSRESNLVKQWAKMTTGELQQYYNEKIKPFHEFAISKNISNSFECNCLLRNFGYRINTAN